MHYTAALASGLLAAAVAIFLSAFLRLPLPFDGFAVVFAAAVAFVGTLAISAWMPAKWVWSDAERLRLAFQLRHDLSEEAAQRALVAITDAHNRALQLRQFGKEMRADVQAQMDGVADRLDAAAREIFYAPERHRALRTVLVRSALIEDAASAHAGLRKRGHEATEDAARDKLLAAIAALDAAFDQTDLLAAKGLLRDVAIASDVAERLLTPQGRS